MHPILFAGDPHRNFSPLIRACLDHPADRPGCRPTGTLVIVGDCDCPAPLPSVMAPVLAAGWDIRWILGNHDTDTEQSFDHLVAAHPDGDLGLRVTEIDGLRIGGLPGVFKPRVWYPRADTPGERIEPARFRTRDEFLRSLRPGEAWRGGLPLWHRDTIFPEDIENLARHRCDVLVTHEAPSSHEHGFTVIDDLAAACGASLIVHGHHHRSYEHRLANGVRVRGLGLSEIYPLAR
jgi:predicted phosphodiesterase